MAVIWGIPYLLIRVAVRQLDPGVLVLARTAPAALLTGTTGRRSAAIPALIRHFKWIAVFGVLEFGFPWYLMGRPKKHITSSLTSLLICCVPLFSVIAQRFGLPRAASRRAATSAWALAPRRRTVSGSQSPRGTITWIGLMMGVCVGYTIGPILLATKLKDVAGPTVVMGATGFVALCWIPWDLAHWPAHVNGETWSCVAVLSVVCTVARSSPSLNW